MLSGPDHRPDLLDVPEDGLVRRGCRHHPKAAALAPAQHPHPVEAGPPVVDAGGQHQGGQAVGGAFHRARLDDKTAFFPGLVGDLGFIEGLAGGEGEDPPAGQGLVQGEDPLGQAVGDVEGEAQLGQAEDGGELQAPGGDAGALPFED